MSKRDKLTDEEFVQMLHLIERYANTEMDQWELWKFNSPYDEVYVDISRCPSHKGCESSYTDLSHLMTYRESNK